MTDAGRRRPFGDRGRAWALVAGFLALASIAVYLAAGPAVRALDWQPELAAAEPWRAWSAAWVHLSALHLLANVAGAAVTGFVGLAARLPARSALAWLIAWPLTQLLLLLRTDLARYAGLSGVLHAGVACAATALLMTGSGDDAGGDAGDARRRRRAIGAAILAVLAVKVALETPWGAPLRYPAGWDIAVAPFAHATGLVAGIVVAALVEGLARRRHRPPA